jgi:hypothetical protein
MNEFNTNSLATTITSNSKCYIQHPNQQYYLDKSDMRILNIGKVVTPALPYTQWMGVNPKYRRCDVEVDLLITSNEKATIKRENMFFEVMYDGATPDCKFKYKPGSISPLGAGVFIQSNTPSLRNLTRYIDSNTDLPVKYQSVNFVTGFLASLTQSYNRFITFITGNSGVNAELTSKVDALSNMLFKTGTILSESDMMLSNYYAGLTFKNCPPPSPGTNICMREDIIQDIRRVYDLTNYPSSQFGVKKKIMDTIFRVAPSQTGENIYAACDVAFNSWELNYVDLFDTPVGNPKRMLEAARFYFKQRPGQTGCEYYATMEEKPFADLANNIGSTALRVAGSNLPVPRKVMLDPMCQVNCVSSNTINMVKEYYLRTKRKNIREVYRVFQATPMKCQYAISINNTSNYDGVIDVPFTLLPENVNCDPKIQGPIVEYSYRYEVSSNEDGTKLYKSSGINLPFPGILAYGQKYPPKQPGVMSILINTPDISA